MDIRQEIKERTGQIEEILKKYFPEMELKAED